MIRAPSPDAGHPLRRAAWAARSALLASTLGTLAVGCAPGDPEGRWVATELRSPAGEGSGEPFLSSSGDTVFLSWLERAGPDQHELRFARLEGGEWSQPVVVASSAHFLVNWADFPSVSSGSDGSLWAHWLERGPPGSSGYGIRIARSSDGGATWTGPWTPHEDGTATDHGFVSTVDMGGERGFLWLDGRKHEGGPRGEPAGGETALYFRTMGPEGPSGPESVVDARVCDCCQTDVALTSAGPVAVYRGRSEGEIRDIRFTRYRDGAWSEGRVVHEDGWETGACPVNGPAVSASAADVVVAWFTAAGGIPKVQVAFSDGADAFARPVSVDDGNPAGRVDVVMLDGESALVSWLERTGGEGAEVRVRRVTRGGRLGESVRVSGSSVERASGFPRLVGGTGAPLIVAWTDVTDITPQVRVVRIELRTDLRTEEGT